MHSGTGCAILYRRYVFRRKQTYEFVNDNVNSKCGCIESIAAVAAAVASDIFKWIQLKQKKKYLFELFSINAICVWRAQAADSRHTDELYFQFIVYGRFYSVNLYKLMIAQCARARAWMK